MPTTARNSRIALSSILHPPSSILHPLSSILSRIPLPSGLSLLIIALMAIVYLSPFADVDYTWHIRTGEEIVRRGELRTPDEFSYTIAGKRVADFEWLYEVILWSVWSTLRYGGLKFLKVLVVAGPLAILAWRLRCQGVGRRGILLSMPIAIIVTSTVWNLRPLFLTTMGLLLVSGWLHDHCTGRKPLALWLPVVMLIWSNIHPGVITGQGLLVGAIAWEWLNRWLKINRPLDTPSCLRLTLISGLGLAATFVAPNPIERLLYPFRPELAHPIMRVFVEMQPLYTFVLRSPYTAGLVYLVAGLVGITIILRFREYRLWELALLAGLAVLANIAFRSVQDWLLVMLALGVPHLVKIIRSRVLDKETRRQGDKEQDNSSVTLSPCHPVTLSPYLFDRPMLRFQPGWLIAGLVLLGVPSLFPPLACRTPNWVRKELPTGAVTWIEAEGLHGNFFGPADYCTYLRWKAGERVKVYVDTRGFFFPPELLEDSHYLPQMTPGWQARLQRVLGHGTDYFLLETNGPRGELWRQLQPVVGEPLFLDSRAVLLTAEQVRIGVDRLAD